MKVSVVVATYNRANLLQRLLDDLAAQSLPRDAYELVLVDDGSKEPVRPHVTGKALPYALTLVEQENQGQARARHHGIERARGDLIVIVDDDMALPPDFLQRHLDAHARGCDVVMGLIVPPPGSSLPLFERFHADQLVRFAAACAAGAPVRGVQLATGNVSFRRQDYLDVGGFDPSLKRSEDRELGVRFEKAGKKLGFAPDAVVVHWSDHASLDGWLRRSLQYGVYDTRISNKHDDVEDADPWSFLTLVSPVSRPVLLAAAAAPDAAGRLAAVAMKIAEVVDRAGFERLALQGCTFAYGLQYFRGVREENGGLVDAAKDLGRWAKKRARKSGRPLAKLVDGVLGDHDAWRAARAKYHGARATFADLPKDAVTKIGFQMMIAYRVMRFCKDANIPLGKEVASRLIRHLYGAELHWDADLAPGVSVVHGNGLVLSHAAKVGRGCILFQNATLGESMDPETGTVGGPTLKDDVHVGPGAVLLGPITVGEGTKIMAGAVLTKSVPPYSVVMPAEARVAVRARRKLDAAADRVG
jgi:serine acetyltransferase/GT2 family glycosyltransferase